MLHALHIFEKCNQPDETGPDKTEYLQHLLGLSVHYKNVEKAMQEDGEDNSNRKIDCFFPARLEEGKCQCSTYGRRGKYMKKRRADEAVIAGDDCLCDGKARERREEEERVFGCGKTERHDYHIDYWIYRFIVFVTPEHHRGRGREFEDFLYSCPDDEGKALAGGIEDRREFCVGRNVGGGELLDGDNYTDRNGAGKKGERDKALRLGVLAVFPQPKPQPDEGGEEPASRGSEDGPELSHGSIISSNCAARPLLSAWPLCDHQKLTLLFWQLLPNCLGHKRHEGVEEFE